VEYGGLAGGGARNGRSVAALAAKTKMSLLVPRSKPEKKIGGVVWKSGKSIKPEKPGNISCRRHFTREVNWWSSKD